MASAWRAGAALATVTGLLLAGPAATYRVQKGDTLDRIARRFGTTTPALAAANAITDHDHVVAGRVLQVPSAAGRVATRYVVREGDALDRIARRFGTTTAALMSANGIRSADLIRIGQRLTIPAGAAATTTAAAPAGGSSGLPGRLLARPERLALMPRFDAWARTYGVPADLLKAMTWVESGWQMNRVSSTGAIGIGQLMPDTVDFVSGVLLRADLDPRRTDDNIRMSARFLRYLLDQTGGRVDQALAAYYQGLQALRSRGMYPGTRQYVATVLAFRPRFR